MSTLVVHLLLFQFFLQCFCNLNTLSLVRQQRKQEIGICSFYGDGEVPQGSPTANGESFDRNAMTAAHKTLPFGTKVQVFNPSNRKTVLVRINDRGPFIEGRILDLTYAAFSKIEKSDKGLIYNCTYLVV